MKILSVILFVAKLCCGKVAISKTNGNTHDCTDSDFRDCVYYAVTMSTANGSISKYVDYLNLSVSSWKRPESPPRVWSVFEGRKKTVGGGIPKFVIQEVPKDLEDDVLDFMEKYFLVEEPVAVAQSFSDDPLAVREFRTLWRDIVRQGVSVVALTENSDPTAKPVIAGVNVLNVTVAEDLLFANSHKLEYRSEPMRSWTKMEFKLLQDIDVMKKYGIDRYLAAVGLSVHPSFRGQGLGEEILRVRDDIGLAYQIPVSETIFTATASQILATRVGYEVLLERKYSELLTDEGEVTFPGVTAEFIKVMAKRLY